MGDETFLGIAQRLVDVLREIQATGFGDEDLIQEAKTLNLQLRPVYNFLYGGTPLIVTEYPSWVWWRRAMERATTALAAVESGAFADESDVPRQDRRSEDPLLDALPPRTDFDVALTFAGEDRAYVQAVAESLRDRGVKVFYDKFVRAQMWGTDLYDFFDEVFQKHARFAVMFVSEHYVGKEWPNHERRSAQARALVQSSPYILPVRLDDSELPGLRPTVAYEDARRVSTEELVDLLMEKLSIEVELVIPSTPAQLMQLAETQTPFWEYRLFAGYLIQGKRSLESLWHDHDLHLRQPGGTRIAEMPSVFDFVNECTDRVLTIVENFNQLLLPDVQERAFGAPGEPGNPERIEHLGRRLVSVYEDLLDWALEVRSARPPEEFRELLDSLSHYADQPLEELRRFIDAFETSLRDAIDAHDRGDTSQKMIDLAIVLIIPDNVKRRFDEALQDLHRALGI